MLLLGGGRWQALCTEWIWDTKCEICSTPSQGGRFPPEQKRRCGKKHYIKWLSEPNFPKLPELTSTSKVRYNRLEYLTQLMEVTRADCRFSPIPSLQSFCQGNTERSGFSSRAPKLPSCKWTASKQHPTRGPESGANLLFRGRISQAPAGLVPGRRFCGARQQRLLGQHTAQGHHRHQRDEGGQRQGVQVPTSQASAIRARVCEVGTNCIPRGGDKSDKM